MIAVDGCYDSWTTKASSGSARHRHCPDVPVVMVGMMQLDDASPIATVASALSRQ
jgi:hypothetical protein